MNRPQRRVLVTAGSSGIGRGVAERLVAEGHQVFLTGVRDDLLSETSRELGAAGHVACDFTVPGAAANAAETAVDVMGGVDVLVSNTGGPRRGRFLDLSTADWEQSYRLILEAAIQLTSGVLPGMTERGWGRLIYLTSTGVMRALPQLHLSNVMRAGVEALANSLVAELGPLGVTTHVIAPAHIDTERRRDIAALRAQQEGVPPERIDDRDLEGIPVGRFGTPADVGALVAFLSSDESGYLTGQTHAVDGGFVHIGALS